MRSRRRSPIRKRVFIALGIFFLILLGIGIFMFGKYLFALAPDPFDKGVQLKATPEKRVNLLLLGVGGGNHEGPNLTDTIIFASLDPQTTRVTLVSIPRDVWIPDLDAKINSAYVHGDEKQAGSGLLMSKTVVSNVVGQQIDYAVKIDFSGFEKAVDAMGGLDIDVANTFDDYAYPIGGKEDEPCGHSEEKIASLSAQIASGSATELEAFPCRYEHLHFAKGPTTMDGVTALKYVRSRHALGKEGSDFARSKRQEKVISAFKEKLFSVGTLLNPVKLSELVDILQGSIETDIKGSEYDDFVKLAKKLEHAKIQSLAVDAGDSAEDRWGLLSNPPPSPEYGNQWILAPRVGNGDFSEIKEYVGCKIKGTNCYVGEFGVLTPTPKPTAIPTKTRAN